MDASPQGRGRSWRDSRWGTGVVAVLAATTAILLYRQLGPPVNAPTTAIQDPHDGDGAGSPTLTGRGRVTHSPTIMRDRPVVGEQGELSPIPWPQPTSLPNDITASSSPAFSIPPAVPLPQERDTVFSPGGIPAETASPAERVNGVSSSSVPANSPGGETTSAESNTGAPGRITTRLQAPPDLTAPKPSESAPSPLAATPAPELPRESAGDPVAKIAPSDAPSPQHLAAEAKPPEATRPAPVGSPQRDQSAQDAAIRPPSTSEPAASSPGAKPREYTVQEGDTLFDIAQQELGAAKHWPRIYRLNRDRLGDNFGSLPVGLKLAIPTEPPATSTR